jgi:hypothetical protein
MRSVLALLVPLRAFGVRRFGQVRFDAHPLQLLNDIAPAGRDLNSEGDLSLTKPLGELIKPLYKVLAVGWMDLAPAALAGAPLYVLYISSLGWHTR